MSKQYLILLCVFKGAVLAREEKLNMAKKLIYVWLFTMTIVLFSSISVYAEDGVQGDFFIKNVVINGERIENYNLQYSIILYNDTMYIPLVREMREIYGVEMEMDWESHTLKLLKVEPARKNISENWLKNDAHPLFLNVIPDAKVFAYAQETNTENEDADETTGEAADEANETADEATGEIGIPELRVEEIDLNGMPLLVKDRHIYIPLRAVAGNELFNWDIHFDNYYGVCISTDSSIPAITYFNEKEALENKGLVHYIMHYNPRLTLSYAQQLVFLFKRAGEVYEISPKLLMAIAHRESTFNNGSIGRGGSAGLMQVMPGTGARYGLTQQQLLDPKISIDFGAMYMSERLAAFDGDVILALSAYNQGSTTVNRGRHSTTYANRIIATYYGVHNFLEMNGYIIE